MHFSAMKCKFPIKPTYWTFVVNKTCFCFMRMWTWSLSREMKCISFCLKMGALKYGFSYGLHGTKENANYTSLVMERLLFNSSLVGSSFQCNLQNRLAIALVCFHRSIQQSNRKKRILLFELLYWKMSLNFLIKELCWIPRNYNYVLLWCAPNNSVLKM